MNHTKILSFVLMLLFMTSCSNDDTECENAVCTAHIEVVSIKVVDQAGLPVQLDNVIIANHTGEIIDVNQNPNNTAQGLYLLVDDSHAGQLPLETNIVTFRGMKDNQQVVYQEFVIVKDCCHISKEEGPEEITID